MRAFRDKMVRQVKRDAARRVLQVLAERYPVTVRQVALQLRLREDRVLREAKALRSRGLVTVEPLGDETYLALTGAGIELVGLSASEAAALRRRQREGRPPPPKPRDPDDPAFM